MISDQVGKNAMRYALGLVAIGVLEIDDRGRIWRRRVKRNGEWVKIRRRRAENTGGGGYLRLTFRGEDGAILQVMAHRLVWAVNNQSIPDEGLQIDHIDMRRQNNHPANLELVTQSVNIRRRVAMKARTMAVAA